MTPQRPGVFRWLWYALGGGLPERYRDWVLHDTTCRTWHLRHFGRALVQMCLIIVPVLVIVPGPLWVRLVGILLGFLVGLQYALFTLQEAVEHRARKAGFPPGYADGVRNAGKAEERAAAAARYAAKYRNPG